MTDWQDISTAPTDGTEVLVTDGNLVWISSRLITKERGKGGMPLGWNWGQPTIYNTPTAWQPKPLPPPHGVSANVVTNPDTSPTVSDSAGSAAACDDPARLSQRSDAK